MPAGVRPQNSASTVCIVDHVEASQAEGTVRLYGETRAQSKCRETLTSLHSTQAHPCVPLFATGQDHSPTMCEQCLRNVSAKSRNRGALGATLRVSQTDRQGEDDRSGRIFRDSQTERPLAVDRYRLAAQNDAARSHSLANRGARYPALCTVLEVVFSRP